MALENAVIAKIGGSLVAVGGVTGVGIAFKDRIFNFFSGNETFLILKTVDSSTSDSSLEELYKKEENKPEVKNFTCKYTVTTNDVKEDTTCDIFSLTPKTADKLIDLKAIQSVDKKTVKTDITTNKFFKLRVKKNTFSINKFDGTEKIVLFSNSEDKKDKKYGEFKVLYKIEGNTVTGKSNLIIGRAKNKNTESGLTVDSGSTCSINNSEKKDCAIFKFDAQPANKSFSDLAFATNKPVALTVDALKDGDLFLIDLKEQKLNISDFTSKTVVAAEKKDTDAKKLADFDFVAVLATDSDSFTASSTTTFFLS